MADGVPVCCPMSEDFVWHGGRPLNLPPLLFLRNSVEWLDAASSPWLRGCASQSTEVQRLIFCYKNSHLTAVLYIGIKVTVCGVFVVPRYLREDSRGLADIYVRELMNEIDFLKGFINCAGRYHLPVHTLNFPTLWSLIVIIVGCLPFLTCGFPVWRQLAALGLV